MSSPPGTFAHPQICDMTTFADPRLASRLDSRQVRYPDSTEALAERLYKDWHCARKYHKSMRNLQDLGPSMSSVSSA